MTDSMQLFFGPRLKEVNLRFDVNIAIVLSIPLLLFLSNEEWLFSFPRNTDPWIYYAYWFNYTDHSPTLESSYKSGRILWILKGYLLYKVFSPLTAYYILHFSTFYICLIAFYLIVKHVLDKHTATLATIAFGFYSQFHSIASFEWDYHNHETAADFLLTLLFLTFAAKAQRWQAWLFLAGAAYASALQAFHHANYLPAVAFWYLYLNHKHQKHLLLPSAVWFAAGGLAAVLAYCSINYLTGGNFFFFLPQLKQVLMWADYSRYQPGYWSPLSEILQSYSVKGIVLPFYTSAFALALCGVCFIKRPVRAFFNNVVFLQIFYLLIFATHMFWHFWGQPLLGQNSFIINMAPAMFLSIAGLISYLLTISNLKLHQTTLTLLSIFVLCIFAASLVASSTVFPLLDSLLRPLLVSLPPFAILAALPSFAILAAILVTMALMSVALGTRASRLFSLVFSSFTFSPRAISGIVRITILLRQLVKQVIPISLLLIFLFVTNLYTASIPLAFYDWRFKCGINKDSFLAVVDSYLQLKKAFPGPKDLDDYRDLSNSRSYWSLGMWYTMNNIIDHPDQRCKGVNLSSIYGYAQIDLSGVYGALNGARYGAYYGPGIFSKPYIEKEKFSDLTISEVGLQESIKYGKKVSDIAIFSHNERDHETAISTLQSLGLAVNIIKEIPIEYGAIRYKIVVVEMKSP